MRGRLRAVAAALWGMAALGAWAQETTLGTSDAVRCLAPADVVAAGPEYEFELWKGEKAGRVVVEAEFAAPDLAPAIKVLSSEGDPAFVASVRRHVARWRVPCMAAGAAPVRLAREYVFQPMSQRPVQGAVADAADELRRDLLKCLHHPVSLTGPRYPQAALRQEVQGRVHLNLRFTDPGRAPEAQVLARPAARLLQQAVERWLADLRMPCLTGEAVNASMTFSYRIEGEPAYGLKPLTLLQVLRVAKGLDRIRFQADTRTMGCPFELRLLYLQPYAPNVVYSVGAERAEREPLLELLRGLQLDLDRRSLDSIYADRTMINVACSNFDLKPQGETS